MAGNAPLVLVAVAAAVPLVAGLDEGYTLSAILFRAEERRMEGVDACLL